MRVWIHALLITFLSFASHVVTAGEILRFEASHSQVRLLLERESLVVGDTNWLAFEISPRDGWHSYWKNPGDSGAAPIFEWSLPEELSVGDTQFAAPERIPVAHLMNYGYRGTSVVLLPIEVTEIAESKPFSVGLVAEWLICEVECVPQIGEWRFELPTVSNNDANSELSTVFSSARNAIPEPAYWDSKLVLADVSSELYVFADERELQTLESAYFYPEGEGVTTYAAEQLWEVSENGLLVRMQRPRTVPNSANPNGILQIRFRDGGQQSFALEPMFKQPDTEKASAATSLADTSFPLWQAAIYAFAGGLILNLMPCVFPILSLKAFAFVSANYKTAANRRKEGWAYTLGIWLSFMVIVAALMVLRAGGAAIGWGFQLQEPVFVGLLAVLMVFVALSLAGMFSINIGVEGAGQSFAAREGVQGAFFKGVLATLVATPCTAPLMAPAIGFALTQPIMTVVLVFSLLAFGLAAPFLLLSYSERVAAAMPKPGPWMEKVKQALAFPMLLTAAWLVYVFDLQAGSSATLALLVSLIVIAFTVWLWQAFSSKVAKGIAILLAATALAGLVRMSTADAPLQSALSNGEMSYSEAALNDQLTKGKPVFVYFTAEWCITCKVNEKVALHREDTQDAFRDKGVVVMKGDWTNKNNEIAAVLARYGRAGVPLYLYFPAGSREAIVLPEIITASTIIDIL